MRSRIEFADFDPRGELFCFAASNACKDFHTELLLVFHFRSTVRHKHTKVLVHFKVVLNFVLAENALV